MGIENTDNMMEEPYKIVKNEVLQLISKEADQIKREGELNSFKDKEVLFAIRSFDLLPKEAQEMITNIFDKDLPKRMQQKQSSKVEYTVLVRSVIGNGNYGNISYIAVQPKITVGETNYSPPNPIILVEKKFKSKIERPKLNAKDDPRSKQHLALDSFALYSNLKSDPDLGKYMFDHYRLAVDKNGEYSIIMSNGNAKGWFTHAPGNVSLAANKMKTLEFDPKKEVLEDFVTELANLCIVFSKKSKTLQFDSLFLQVKWGIPEWDDDGSFNEVKAMKTRVADFDSMLIEKSNKNFDTTLRNNMTVIIEDYIKKEDILKEHNNFDIDGFVEMFIDKVSQISNSEK